MPLVWCTRWRIRTGSAHAGRSGKCFRSGSSSDSSPWSSATSTAATVNCLDTDAIRKMESEVSGIP